MMLVTEIQVGDYVGRAGGSYRFPGQVKAVYEANGVRKCDVQLAGFGMLHIFNERQLKKITAREHDIIAAGILNILSGDAIRPYISNGNLNEEELAEASRKNRSTVLDVSAPPAMKPHRWGVGGGSCLDCGDHWMNDPVCTPKRPAQPDASEALLSMPANTRVFDFSAAEKICAWFSDHHEIIAAALQNQGAE